MNSGLCYCTQAEGLPAVSQTATESDSDSGMGSPEEEMVTETANKREELPGKVTQQWMIIQPERSRDGAGDTLAV